MSRLTEEEVKKNPEKIYTNFTSIYTDAITKYDAIQLYTFQSMLNNIKEYDVFHKRWINSISKIRKLQKDIEQKHVDGYVISNQLETISNRMAQSDYLLHMIPSNLVVSLITNFDQFLSNMLTYLFQHINGQINVIEESVRYNELCDCNDTCSIQDFYIEKFTDSFFRKSHKEQFEWLDKKLSINIKTQMQNYDDFIFLCELRNSIIHNDSKPSNFFFKTVNIDKYKKYGFNIEKNKRIVFNPNNITFLFYTVHLSTTYLFSILGQKYYSKDEKMIEYIENAINENVVDKLKISPRLAVILLKNQLSNYLKHSSDYSYMYRINLCIAYKKLNEIEKVKDILKSMDWTNCSDRFIYAKYVLLEDKENIIRYMQKFTEPDWRLYYQVWPLFDNLRNEDYFKTEYQKIFGEEFVYNPVNLKVTPKDIQKVEKELKKKSKKEEA